MNKTKKDISIFNVPIVCTNSVSSLKEYTKQNKEEIAGLSKALEEGYEIIATHSLSLANAGYIAFVLCKEVEIVSTKQVEQEDLQGN